VNIGYLGSYLKQSGWGVVLIITPSMIEVKETVLLFLLPIPMHSWHGIKLRLPEFSFFTPSKISKRTEHVLIQGVVDTGEVFLGKTFGKLG
jgi:hypothetical protein